MADTYDAILSDRPYRTPQDQARAFEVLRTRSGKQFDPGVVRAFLFCLSLTDGAVPAEPAEDRATASD